MKKEIARILLLTIVILFLSCTTSRDEAVVTASPNYPDVRFIHCTDIHLMDPELGTTGPAFQEYLNNDRKLLAESLNISEAAFRDIAAEQSDFVIISGDLTKDGETLSHQRLSILLKQVEESGKSVFVVPGNHDILNPDAHIYDGEEVRQAEYVSVEEFRSLYADFGYSEALVEDPHSLSYVAEPVDGLWLLALDSCKYDKNIKKKHACCGRRL